MLLSIILLYLQTRHTIDCKCHNIVPAVDIIYMSASNYLKACKILVLKHEFLSIFINSGVFRNTQMGV